MREREKVSIDPKQSTVDMPPVQEVQYEVRYKRLSTTAALRAKFSEEPKTYNVSISATHVDRRFDVSDVYDEYHPLMAIGRAIMDLKRTRGFASIECIEVYERILAKKTDNH